MVSKQHITRLNLNCFNKNFAKDLTALNIFHCLISNGDLFHAFIA